MKVRYSLNWMGIANLRWYRDRNLLDKRTITLTENSILVKQGNYKPGDQLNIEEPRPSYSCGRIDIRGGDTGPYGEELGVPSMLGTDWNRFGGWLRTFETDDIWTLNQLVAEYEISNPKITWWKDNEPKIS